MTQEQYKRKCDALFSKAKNIGVELSFIPKALISTSSTVFGTEGILPILR